MNLKIALWPISGYRGNVVNDSIHTVGLVLKVGGFCVQIFLQIALVSQDISPNMTKI